MILTILRALSNHDGMDVVKSFYYFIDWGAQSLVSDQNELEKVLDVLAVIDLLQLLLRNQIEFVWDHADEEPSKVGVI